MPCCLRCLRHRGRCRMYHRRCPCRCRPSTATERTLILLGMLARLALVGVPSCDIPEWMHPPSFFSFQNVVTHADTFSDSRRNAETTPSVPSAVSDTGRAAAACGSTRITTSTSGQRGRLQHAAISHRDPPCQRVAVDAHVRIRPAAREDSARPDLTARSCVKRHPF